MDRRTKREIIATLIDAGRPDLVNVVAFDPPKGGQDFFDQFGVKDKWINLTPSNLVKNPRLADELFWLLSVAYRDIGGHLKFKSVRDLFDSRLVFHAIDVDQDPQSDAVKFLKKTPGGLKSVGMGHDGGGKAKDVTIKRSAKDLKTHGYYAEMSGAIAHIMLTRHGVQSVNDENVVRSVLKGKPLEWIGPHPQGKYPDNPGWYNRAIGGKKAMKIMLGLPLVK